MFDNSYHRELRGLYVACPPASPPQPRTLKLNAALADELGFDLSELDQERVAAIFSGAALPEGAITIAQAYAGHQFGGFSPQLGDGRALLMGEVLDKHGHRRDIAFKGSGRTPFSRNGDGKAAVGPVLREYLIGEAMHALRIPTTRALAAVATGETVYRDKPLPGAVLTRVAASHIRVGTFEYFAARRQYDHLRRLADYAISRHYPALSGTSNRYVGLLREVSTRQAQLIAHWMLVGFIHGVMNTDNMTISGETIDYGPCAFMEGYTRGAVFSSIDSGGRYAFDNQPGMAHWNLARLAETLIPLIVGDGPPEPAIEELSAVLDQFPFIYTERWLDGVRAKLGLTDQRDGDAELVDDWLNLLQAQRVDYTLAWRRLGDVAAGKVDALSPLFADMAPVDVWLARWRQRTRLEVRLADVRADAMHQVNPIYIPRNHRVEEALQAASDRGDLAPFNALLAAITHPFDERAQWHDYAVPAPGEVTASYQTFCGT